MKKRQQYKEAFSEPANLIALATASSLAMVTGNPVVGIGAAVLEALYLLFFPDTKYYQGVLMQRDAVSEEKESESQETALYHEANSSLIDKRDKFKELWGVYTGLKNNTAKEMADLYASPLRTMFSCLKSYVKFAQQEQELTAHLVSLRFEMELKTKKNRKKDDEVWISTDEWVNETIAVISDSYSNTVSSLTSQFESCDPSDPIYSVLQQRLAVAQRRLALVGRNGSMLRGMRQQMELLEETFGLLNDQMRMRQPGEITSVLENLVNSTQHMTETMAEFDQLKMTGLM